MNQRTKCVLIEDNEQNRYLLTYLLQHRGFDVVSANNGLAGLALLPDSGADLVLLDIQLPGLDGFEIARRIRQDARLARLPLIAVSSFAMPSERDKALAAGFDGYIEKPIDPQTFADQIRQFLPA